MSSYHREQNQECLENYEYIETIMSNRNRQTPQELAPIYKELEGNMYERFGDSILVTNFNPTNSSVYHMTVLFDRNGDTQSNISHDLKTIVMILNDQKLGYFKGTGRNDYELSYHKILVEKNIPLPVLHTERYSKLKKPTSADARFDAFKEKDIIPFFYNRTKKRFKKQKEYWGRVDDLQTARKKESYLRRKEIPKEQTVFACDVDGEFSGTVLSHNVLQTTLDENNAFLTPKFIKRPRNDHTRSIRNDIVYKTQNGSLISEVKPSAEISDKKVRLLYKQLMAYDAEQKFYNNYHTPIVVTIPVLPPKKQLSILEKVQKDTGRKIGVMCIAEHKRFLDETSKGMNIMEQRAKREKSNFEIFDAERSLLEDYHLQFLL